MGASDESDSHGGYALGDLDLDGPAPAGAGPKPARPPAAPAAPQARPATPSTGGQRARGGADDLDLSGFGGDGDGPLELDSSNDNWRGNTDHLLGGMDGDGDDPLYAPAAMPMPELDDVPRRPARFSGTRSDLEAKALEQDPRRMARALARFGPDPKGLIGCVPYVLRVVARRHTLAAERKKVSQNQRGLRAQLDEALLELGRALSQKPPEQLARIKPALDSVLMARGAAEAADQNAAESRRQTETQIRELDAEIVERKRAMEPLVATEAEASRRLAQVENERKRAQALLNRVDIDRRSKETAQGQLSDQDEQQFSARRVECEGVLARAQAACDEARAVHDEARQALDEKQRDVDGLALSRRRLSDQTEKEQRKLETAAAGAESELTQRLRDLGRAAMEAKLEELGGDRARRVRDLDGQFTKAAEQKQLYDLARQSYDRSAIARGVGLVVFAIGGAFAALNFL